MAPPFKRTITYRKPVVIALRTPERGIFAEIDGVVRIEMLPDHHILYRKGSGASLVCAGIVPSELLLTALA